MRRPAAERGHDVRSSRVTIGAHGAAIGRWGLLVTAIALVVALIGTGVAAYLEIGRSSVPLVRTLARDLVASARRSLHAAGALTPEAAAEVLAALEEDGIRYVAVIANDGRPIAAAGTPAMATRRDARGATPQEPDVEVRGDGARARATGPFVGRGGGRGWRMRTGAGPDAPLPWHGLASALIVVEFEPRALATLRARAAATLAVGACTGLALLGAAVVFWRVSRRAERAAAQLERDRQLKRLGQMSAVLGHELRNPLAGLKGHAQLILRKLPGEHSARRDAETVVREAVRLELLADQVLEFARTGEVELAAEDPLAIARAAAEAVDADRVRMERPPAPLPSWPLDRARMEQVLTNLLRNAIQASPGGGAVELAAFLDEGDQLVFEVRGQQMRQGRFREDLYHRLAVFPIRLLPLRERPLDVEPLADHLLARIAVQLGRPALSLSPQARETLTTYPWPGNVRDLANVLERAAILADGPVIDARHLSLEMQPGPAAAEARLPEGTLAELEREAIRQALMKTGGHRKQAAALLGIGLRTLYEKLKQHALE